MEIELGAFYSLARRVATDRSALVRIRVARAAWRSARHVSVAARLVVGEFKSVTTPERAGPNLLGDRDIEGAWVASKLPDGEGDALDFGNGGSNLGLIAAEKGFEVLALDLGPVQWPYCHPRLHFLQGDLLKLNLPSSHFDLVINCSTVEHVGLVGRYGVTDEDMDGDLRAMTCLLALMKPEGTMILTIPMGQDEVFAPLCRVYGAHRLPLLLEGFRIQEGSYWVKDESNRWVPASKDEACGYKASASSWNATENVYALGCFVLRRPSGES